MKHLVNNILRTKNMVGLLNAMGVPLENTKVACKDERVIFNSGTTKEAEALAANLQDLLQKDTVKPTIRKKTVAELLAEEITYASCADSAMSETHKKSCLAVLSVLQLTGLEYTLDEQQEYINIQLPSAAYAPLFNSLTYKYMSIEGEKIKFNIKEFLKAYKQELILIDGKSPLLFAHSESFESKKVFYAEKKVSEDTTEITPYFFVPDALTPPAYHFVLDTSGSMEGERLTTLKKSVIELADALFQFQPDAVINISEFNSTTRKVGSYRKQDATQLTSDINKLRADHSTRLLGTVSDQLSMLVQSTQHNNVILFTDGENSIGNEEDQTKALEKMVESLGGSASLIRVRNKFFILSYGTKQPEVLHKVAQAFDSPVLETNTIDFTAALSEKGKLQEWAAARELFTCRLEIADSSGLDTKSEEYVQSCDMSGQFVALKPQQYQNNESLHLTIKDGNGKTLLDDKRSLAKKSVESVLLPGSAKAAVQHGMFTLPTQVTTDAPKKSVTPTII
ncbi:marine proteobacterial sortase target protein [Legionella steigerwaltii]|uniref:Marine proteobacterial sortase target protein n=1 Tax=Legionella steigerwaltii TaxID=460 RepID=A0A378L3N2_9GAMM|nr:VWA domain-containing protein [Legionella steigerwaltii]KTD72029.1 von Willebrand factor type A domain protein [Legionella steigerwaltii]STY21695.1 marine proteobacterial sortase target protein [Legionella steigerwaltii]